MVRKLLIPLFIVALGASSTVIRAADTQSAHFPVAPPPASTASGADLQIGVQAQGLGEFQTIWIDLVPADGAGGVVARKASRAVCVAAFAKHGPACSLAFAPAPLPAGCAIGAPGAAACCDVFDP